MDRPNIILLMTDEQRYDTIAAAGHEHMITPNLDRLAGEGCLFENAFTPNPICMPARHNVITGLPASVHGFAKNDHRTLDQAIPTLPRILADHGYDTRAVGKMHFSPPRRHHGFDRMELMEEIPSFPAEDEYLTYVRAVGHDDVTNIHGIRNSLYLLPQRSLVPDEHHGSTWVANRAAAYVREMAGVKPFFLWASWIAPHPPFNVPDEFAELYRDRELPRPIPEGAGLPGRSPNWDAANMVAGREEETLRRIRELYYGAVTHVDRGIGRILEAVDAAGIAEDTLILFTSDHGEMLGDHRRFLKGVPYEQSVRIPCIARWPGRIAAGSRCESFVDLNDLLPTFLDAAGAEYPGPRELPGASVLGLCTGKDVRATSVGTAGAAVPPDGTVTSNAGATQKDRTVQYAENGRGDRRWIMLRDRRYKYTYSFGGGREQLYDLEADPTEQVDLLAAKHGSEVATARDALRRRLTELEERWGMPESVDNGELVALPKPELPKGPHKPNGQFHHFPEALRPVERERLRELADEYLEATKYEPTVSLGRIDLSPLERHGVAGIERLRGKG